MIKNFGKIHYYKNFNQALYQLLIDQLRLREGLLIIQTHLSLYSLINNQNEGI